MIHRELRELGFHHCSWRWVGRLLSCAVWCQRCGAAPLGLCEGVHGQEAPTEPLHEVVCQLCGGMRVFAGETRAERRVCEDCGVGAIV